MHNGIDSNFFRWEPIIFSVIGIYENLVHIAKCNCNMQ